MLRHCLGRWGIAPAVLSLSVIENKLAIFSLFSYWLIINDHHVFVIINSLTLCSWGAPRQCCHAFFVVFEAGVIPCSLLHCSCISHVPFGASIRLDKSLSLLSPTFLPIHRLWTTSKLSQPCCLSRQMTAGVPCLQLW